MRDDFCVFILTHGRPDNVRTYNTLMRLGYTGYVLMDSWAAISIAFVMNAVGSSD